MANPKTRWRLYSTLWTQWHRVTSHRIACQMPTMETLPRETSRAEKALSSGRASRSRSRETLSTDSDSSSPFPKLAIHATSHLMAPEMPKHSAKERSWILNLSLFTESQQDDNQYFKLLCMQNLYLIL
jgi:hypothetical protein